MQIYAMGEADCRVRCALIFNAFAAKAKSFSMRLAISRPEE